MTKCAELLQENIDIDFLDVNLGCPIDQIYRQVNNSVPSEVSKFQFIIDHQFLRRELVLDSYVVNVFWKTYYMVLIT